MKVIVHQRLLGSVLFLHLNLVDYKVSSKVGADVIFTDCMPSLAIVFCSDLSSSSIEKVCGLQKQMKNAVAVCYGKFSNEDWNAFQMAIPGGSARLVRTVDAVTAAELALKFHEFMQDNERSKLQAEYFELEKSRSCSSEMSRLITTTTLAELDIPDFEASLLADQFPSIGELVSASAEQLLPLNLVEESTIDKVVELFGGATPTLH